MKNATTCQVCGRGIKAKAGVIAHHGYERPGDGWQTASCFGARAVPYEVGCDRLRLAIERVQAHLATVRQNLDNWLTDPPATITYQAVDAWKNKLGEPKVFERPADFAVDSRDYRFESSTFRPSYNQQHARKVEQLRKSIQGCTMQLSYMTERLAAWRAPVAVEVVA